ncbi:DUF4157 domain-containing protein [Methylotenera sp. 1P/1]|uniref:eCIS core domain-containing protein n=1 Tax=Methylotenera sp. 1P/1 TaxID=1131551 RepID=UPI0005273D64|nr:DUF4157 domain-containing protein [Methylotenera sp. 1P/1]
MLNSWVSGVRQQGRPLTVSERDTFKPYFSSVVIEQARIIEGAVPMWLSRRMCAVVLQHRIFFRAGVYQPNTRQGTELLGHELVHVSQFLHGMTLLKYLWSCRRGYRHSVYELEAYAKGAMIARDVGAI